MDRTSKVEAKGRAKRNGASHGQFEELWFTLARRRWNSIVLVPTDPGGSAAGIGKSLAEVGTRLGDIPVTAISVSSLEYDSALALVDLQRYVNRERRGAADGASTISVTGTEVSGAAAAEPAKGAARPRAVASPSNPLAPVPSARIIIAIPAVVSEPLGLAATQSADVIVLTVELGRTRLADARRTIELVGRDRIAGCFLVR